MAPLLAVRDAVNGKAGRMLFLKSCPRCQGDMYLARDYYGTYKECLQCWYVFDLDEKSLRKDPETVRAA